jgi:hypothetical protein
MEGRKDMQKETSIDVQTGRKEETIERKANVQTDK